MTADIFWGLVGSLVGAIATILARELFLYIKSRRGVYSGKWIQIIYDEDGNEIKRDEVIAKHIGNTLRGTVRRVFPENQAHKRWRFEGQIRGRLFFGIFWSTNVVRNPNSYGTLQLNIVNENEMDGFYVKLVTNAEGFVFTQRLKQVKLKWKRA